MADLLIEVENEGLSVILTNCFILFIESSLSFFLPFWRIETHIIFILKLTDYKEFFNMIYQYPWADQRISAGPSVKTYKN